MSTSTLEPDVLPDIEEETTPPDGKAHWARKDAIVSGGVVVALCGKKYVPTKVGQAVLNMPVCSPCAEFYELLKSMEE